MAVNIKDIAREAGVSIATVSRVVNGNRQVSHENRKRVEEVLAKESYVPNPAARNLVLGHDPARLVVVTLPQVLSPFFSELLTGVREGLQGSEFKLVLQEAPDPQSGEHILNDLSKDGLAGMLVLCRNLSDAERRFLRLKKIPFILLDYIAEQDHSFGVDNFIGGEMAAKWLDSRGVKNPVYLGSPPRGIGPASGRWEGFRAFWQQKNIEPGIATSDFDGTSHDFMEKGYQLTRTYFLKQENARVDGVFYLCDEMALGGMGALRELKKDLPVIGFDGWEPAEYLGIATLIQPARQMGRDGAQLLSRLLSGKISEPYHQLYSPILLEPKAALR